MQTFVTYFRILSYGAGVLSMDLQQQTVTYFWELRREIIPREKRLSPIVLDYVIQTLYRCLAIVGGQTRVQYAFKPA